MCSRGSPVALPSPSSYRYISDAQPTAADLQSAAELLSPAEVPLMTPSPLASLLSTPEQMRAIVNHHASQKETPVSLTNLFALGSKPTEKNLLVSSRFIMKEAAIRVARRIIEAESFPFGLSETENIGDVRTLYEEMLWELHHAKEPSNSEEQIEFTRLIQAALTRGAVIGVKIAKGVQEIQSTSRGFDHAEKVLLQEFLDKYITSRISMRLLLGKCVCFFAFFFASFHLFI